MSPDLRGDAFLGEPYLEEQDKLIVRKFESVHYPGVSTRGGGASLCIFYKVIVTFGKVRILLTNKPPNVNVCKCNVVPHNIFPHGVYTLFSIIPYIQCLVQDFHWMCTCARTVGP